MRYHIEIFRDRNIVRVQDQANAYLEECEELDICVEDGKLQRMDSEYHLLLILSIPSAQDDEPAHERYNDGDL